MVSGVDDMSLGENLRNLIDERDMTQKELAKILNIAASTLGGYIQGYSEPDFETLKLLASYFDVSTDYLLDFQRNRSYTRNQQELLRIFDSLTPEQQELYIEQGKAFIRINAKEDVKSSKSTFQEKNNVG